MAGESPIWEHGIEEPPSALASMGDIPGDEKKRVTRMKSSCLMHMGSCAAGPEIGFRDQVFDLKMGHKSRNSRWTTSDKLPL